MTLLEIIQTVCNELGLVAPSSVTGTTDPQSIQLVALANRVGTQLYRDYDWTDLQKEHIVNVEGQIETTGDWIAGTAIVSNIPDTSSLSTSWAVSADGMPQAQRIAEVLSATSVRLEMESTAGATGGDILFAKDTYDLPEDFERYIGKTWWDRTNRWQLIGPDSPQYWQYINSGIFTTGPRRHWRQLGRKPNAWRIWPPPFTGGAPAPGALVFEYISQNWVATAHDGEYTNKMSADADEPLIDSQLIIMGTKWQFWRIKGFEYAALQQEFIDAVNTQFSTDGGIPDLWLNRRSGPYLLTNGNVVDGNYPGPGNS